MISDEVSTVFYGSECNIKPCRNDDFWMQSFSARKPTKMY